MIYVQEICVNCLISLFTFGFKEELANDNCEEFLFIYIKFVNP